MTLSLFPTKPFAFEKSMYEQFGVVAGVDEVGRGCLAGPVVAAAVVLAHDHKIRGITDSKELKVSDREALDEKIRARAVAFGVGVGSVEEIERINILNAALLAMRRAVEALSVAPRIVLVDGRDRIPRLRVTQRAVIDGDARCRVIGAASIIAKVYRDRMMAEFDREFPGYDFASHKGYGSPVHRKAIAKLGPTPLHRRTFSGVREFCEEPATPEASLFE